MDLSIVIPCFNEAQNVPTMASTLTPVVAELSRTCSVELLFVDDGSTDGTGPLLVQAFAAVPNVRIVAHPTNLGLGAAQRTGFAHCTGEVVVTTDSDASYPFSMIVPLLSYLQPGVDVVTASAYHPDGGVDSVSRYRIFLSRGASLLYRLLVDWRVHTYTCLFRAYRRAVVEQVPFESNGFLGVTEVLVNAMLMGFSVQEYPCRVRPRQHGASKAKIFRIVGSHLRLQGRLLWRRLAGAWRPRDAAHHGRTARPFLASLAYLGEVNTSPLSVDRGHAETPPDGEA